MRKNLEVKPTLFIRANNLGGRGRISQKIDLGCMEESLILCLMWGRTDFELRLYLYVWSYGGNDNLSWMGVGALANLSWRERI